MLSTMLEMSEDNFVTGLKMFMVGLVVILVIVGVVTFVL